MNDTSHLAIIYCVELKGEFQRMKLALFAFIGAATLMISFPKVAVSDALTGKLVDIRIAPAEISKFQSNAINPDRPVEVVDFTEQAFSAVIDGGTFRRISSVGEVPLTGTDMNPDDWFWMNEVVKRGGASRLVLNWLLRERSDLGLSSADVINAVDLFDDSDEVLWTDLAEAGWIADAQVSGTSRLLVTFDNAGQPLKMALLDVADVGPSSPESPDRYFAFSKQAELFRADAEAARGADAARLFARCAQQFLLDAGFDPRGVDGAPGNGARAALQSWSVANDWPVPAFTLQNAGQICLTLTSPQSRYQPDDELEGGIYNTFMFGLHGTYNWVGTASVDDPNRGNLFIRAIQHKASGQMRQVLAFEFGADGYGFFQRDGDSFASLEAPAEWKQIGTVLLHGNDQPRLRTLTRLWNSGKEDWKSVMVFGISRQPIDQTPIDTALEEAAIDPNPTGPDPMAEVLFTKVASLNNADIVAADLQLGGPGALSRVVFFFADYPGDDDDQMISSVILRRNGPMLVDRF